MYVLELLHVTGRLGFLTDLDVLMSIFFLASVFGFYLPWYIMTCWRLPSYGGAVGI